MARARVHDTAYLVTTAAPSPQQERRDRERRYLILMGLRVLAVIGAIVVGTQFHLGALVGLLVAAALILPWVAVVVANAPKQRASQAPALWSPHRRRLTSGDQPPDEH